MKSNLDPVHIFRRHFYRTYKLHIGILSPFI
nr:MAG TPA: hypothetical protein [Caudoviricetes sp.]